MSHECAVGQLVHAAGTRFADRASGIYEVIHLMPKRNGEFSYRIKVAASGSERAAGESRIRATGSRQEVPPQAASGR